MGSDNPAALQKVAQLARVVKISSLVAHGFEYHDVSECRESETYDLTNVSSKDMEVVKGGPVWVYASVSLGHGVQYFVA